MRILVWAALAALIATALVVLAYYQDMRRAYDRVDGNSTVISSVYGDIEYTDEGSGPDVLVIHGSGGGYDQGELIAGAVLGALIMQFLTSGLYQCNVESGYQFIIKATVLVGVIALDHFFRND